MKTRLNNKFWKSAIVPLMFAGAMWLAFFAEHSLGVSWVTYGIYPRDLVGLRGIFLSPFIHGDFDHLLNNTYPVILLGTALFYFYPRVAFQIMLYSVIFTGLWVWVGARPSFHIGASGLIYSWGAFLFFSGLFNKNPRMMGLSMLVVFLYGSMIWGVLPWVEGISWESHLFGGISGLILAAFFRKEGPQPKKYSWDFDEEDYPIEYWLPPEQRKKPEGESESKPRPPQHRITVNYRFKKKEEE